MCDMLMDGAPDVEIVGNLVRVKGTSGGERVCYTYRLEHALLGKHRFETALDRAMQNQARVIPFPEQAHAADSA